MRDGTWDAPEGAPNRSKKGLVVTIAIAAVALIAVVIAFQRYGGGDDPLTNATASGTEPLVDPDDIISGGPGPDGIPPIDEPKFLDVAEVEFLEPQEPVVSLVIGDDARAYPLQIMTWHEIANDTVGGVPVTVTFCPLCNTAYAFEQPEIEGEITTFGTSGKLYNSNLVMYDRATESLWPQALGQAVIGPLTGTTLERVPAQIVSWDEFRTSFPDGKVLSRDTGHQRDYGTNPYAGYDDIDNQPFLFKGEVDGRLAAVERILGVETEREIFAFPYFALKEAATDGIAAINAEVGGVPVLVVWKAGAVSALDEASIVASKEVGAAFAFSRAMDGRVLSFDVADGKIVDRQTKSTWNIFGQATTGPMAGEKLEAADAHDSFWFDWAAFHPDTRVWGANDVSNRSHDEFLAATLPALDLVYNLARRLVSGYLEVEDLVQETYMRAFEAWEAGRKPRKVEPWIATICLNVGRSWLRRASTQREFPTEDQPLLADPTNVEERAIEELRRERVHQALWKLPEEQRIAIALMDLDGFTASQVAKLTGSPRGTVLARVHRGRKKLARLLEDEVVRYEP